MSEGVLSSRELTRELLAEEAAKTGGPLLEGFGAIYSAIEATARGVSQRAQNSVADGTADAASTLPAAVLRFLFACCYHSSLQ